MRPSSMKADMALIRILRKIRAGRAPLRPEEVPGTDGEPAGRELVVRPEQTLEDIYRAVVEHRLRTRPGEDLGGIAASLGRSRKWLWRKRKEWGLS